MLWLHYGRPYDSKDRPLCFAADVYFFFIIIIIYLPTSSTDKQQVQSYNSGRTTRQRTALKGHFHYGCAALRCDSER